MGMLDDRVAVITGAGRGIGRAIARLLHDEGAVVVVNDIDPEPLEEVIEHLGGSDGAEAASGDITDVGFVDELVGGARRRHGRLDIVVNNAGMTQAALLHRMDDSTFNRVIDINLGGTFNVLRAAVRIMRDDAKAEVEPGDRSIVNLASVAALGSYSGVGNYVAAKAGVIALTRTAARELGRYHIRVNAVAPGVTDTRLSAPSDGGRGGFPEDILQAQLRGIPLGRLAQPEEMAGPVMFLCSPLATYVNGHVLIVDGGGLPEV